MKLDIHNESFRQNLERWVSTVDDEHIHDFSAVLEQSPGYFPTTLYEAWQQEAAKRGLEISTIEDRFGRDLNQNNDTLPVCHPADYEWRFTPSTSRRLADELIVEADQGTRIAHVGSPSTFMASLTSGHKHVLVDNNKTVIDAVGKQPPHQILTVDVRLQELPTLGARAAIADPPWYPAETTAFLGAANTMCRIGAKVLLCQPTMATRPGVEAERANLLKELPQLGFEHLETRPSFLRYKTPHFEHSSLRTLLPGIPISREWRTGDLLVLRKIGVLAIQNEVSKYELTPNEEWSEVSFGPVRIKLRQQGESDMGKLIPGDILSNVSRRDPLRQSIGFWTSGNRAFSLANVDQIKELVSLLDADLARGHFSLPQTLALADTVGVAADAAERLHLILQEELYEHQERETA